MKKLMTLMLGLSLALGSAAVVFGQDTAQPAKKEEPAKKTTKKAKKAPKKTEAPATEKKG
ncbi:MAG: hypothetical protein ABSH44_14295 [Bryobacteraceae bacterium]|jgi:hypothetical protein